jgi:peroxiredoxin
MTPAVGDKAADFKLNDVDGKEVELQKLVKSGPVVLLVLRGYPSYQCPFCTSQVGDFLGKAEEFNKAGAQLVMVYPGQAEKLTEHAKEFVHDKKWPDNMHLVLDPDLKFVTSLGLRWNKPQETAYPSTFVIDSEQKIRMAKVSKSHDDRSSAADVLDELKKAKGK